MVICYEEQTLGPTTIICGFFLRKSRILKKTSLETLMDFFLYN